MSSSLHALTLAHLIPAPPQPGPDVPDNCPGQPGAADGSSSLIDEIVREGARRIPRPMLTGPVRASAAAAP